MSINTTFDITIGPPTIPTVSVPASPTPGLVILPVQGPIGPQGPAGDTAQTLAFVYSQSTPALSVQISHGLSFHPSGIVCLEADGSPPLLGVSVSYPAPGVIRLGFGVPFTGEIYLS
jgi:hypothetical protein